MTLRVVVGIATIGRAATLCETLRELSLQTRSADAIFVCGTSPADFAGAAEASPGVTLLMVKPGLCPQRNAIIAAAIDADVILFLDDDFVPHPTYLATIEKCMTGDPGIVVATGLVIADGISGPGLTFEFARNALAQRPPGPSGSRPMFSGYGCNMAVRVAPIRKNSILFDERLPLYGWQEDVDFSRRLAAFGSVVQIEAASGVHLGVKHGRNSGVRLGYSQVANPIYLSTKRAGYPLKRAIGHIARNIAMNVARSARPEFYVDRRGRLRGNMLALLDLASGRMSPERILDL